LFASPSSLRLIFSFFAGRETVFSALPCFRLARSIFFSPHDPTQPLLCFFRRRFLARVPRPFVAPIRAGTPPPPFPSSLGRVPSYVEFTLSFNVFFYTLSYCKIWVPLPWIECPRQPPSPSCVCFFFSYTRFLLTSLAFA